MVGRTPEYLGKKIGPFEMKMASLAILFPPIVTLAFTAIAVLTKQGTEGISNPGPHGLSQVLYAFTSMGNNNGSAFAGYGANTVLMNILGGLAMLISRYWLMVPVLAVAGCLAAKKTTPESMGTLPTHTPLFGMLLIVTIIAIDDANVFNFRSDFDDRRRAFDSKLFDHCHRVSSLKKIAVGVSCSFARGGDILLGLV